MSDADKARSTQMRVPRVLRDLAEEVQTESLKNHGMEISLFQALQIIVQGYKTIDSKK